METKKLSAWDIQGMRQRNELKSLSLGAATELARLGYLITRNKSNWKDIFVFIRRKDTMPIITLLGLRSLPVTVKDYFEHKYCPITDENMPSVIFEDYFCMKNAEDNIVNCWVPTQEDILATDWEIFDEKGIFCKK